MNFQGLRFEKPGDYSVDIALDGDIICRVPLRVVKVDAPQA